MDGFEKWSGFVSRNRTTPPVRKELERKVCIHFTYVSQTWRQSQIGRSHSHPQAWRELTFGAATITSYSLPCCSLRNHCSWSTLLHLCYKHNLEIYCINLFKFREFRTKLVNNDGLFIFSFLCSFSNF